VAVFSLNPGILATPISRYFVKGALGDSLASFIMPFALIVNTLIAKVVVATSVVLGVEYTSSVLGTFLENIPLFRTEKLAGCHHVANCVNLLNCWFAGAF
jgi:hypothetical protein